MAGGPSDEPATPVPVAAIEESAEDLYENAPCGYLSALPDGKIVRVNQTFLTWTGYARDDVIGRRFQDMLTPGGRIYHETHYAPLLRMQGEVREIAVEIECAGGRRLPALINSVLRSDDAGRPVVTRTTVFNASDRKQYERELVSARERERVARERTERLQRLTAALAASLEPAEIAVAVCSELRLDDADGVAFALIDSDELEIAATRGGGDDSRRGRCALPTSGPVADALSSGAPVFLAEAAREDEATRLLIGQDPPASAFLPLGTGARSSGIVALRLAPGRGLTDDERAFLSAGAAQSSQALERARLHVETADVARRTAFLAEASHALNAGRTVAERADRLVRLIVPALADAARVELTPLNEEDAAIMVATGVSRLVERPEARRLGRLAVETGVPQEAVDTERGIRYIAAPLGTPGAPLGTLVIAGSTAVASRRLDHRLLAELAERTGLALENARLYEVERSVAHALQQSLLAGSGPADPRVSVATSYSPGVSTLEVGGDWYDAFEVGDGRVAIVVGDVVGRGLGAATTMGQLRSAVRALALVAAGPAELIEHLDAFVDQADAGRMATVAYADIDLGRGVMRYACAGHPPPVLLRPAATPELLWGGRSTPLSAGAVGIPRIGATVEIEPGSRVVLYSDGLVERRDESLDRGLERLTAELDRLRQRPLAALADELASAMLADQAGRDDVCVLCCSFGETAVQLPAPPAASSSRVG